MNEANPLIEAGEQRPWTVVVREGVVVARYRAEDSYATNSEVSHVSLGDGPVDIYEVDARMPPPPNVGDPVTTKDVERWTQAKSNRPDSEPQPTAEE